MLSLPLAKQMGRDLGRPLMLSDGFNPASLFGSTAGLWFNFADISSLYQDNLAATPLTAPDQSIGLAADRSRVRSPITTAAVAQSSLGLRPKWGRAPKSRRNLLTWTEDFSNAAWAKAHGSVSGTRFTPNTTAAVQHRLDQVSAIPAGPQVFWAELKYAGYQWASLRIGAEGAAFDILNGVVGGITSGATATITSLANGNYLCAFFAPSAVANTTIRINVEPTDTIGGQFAGDGVNGLDIIRAQHETGTTISSYQKVTTAVDMTESGVPSYGFIRPDLVDDVLTATLPAAQTGDVAVFGRSGSWIESGVTYGSGSAFSVGATTVTGLPSGLLAAIGDIVGIIAIGRTLTATERQQALEYHKARGAAGWLVAGAEQVANGGYDTDTIWTKGAGWTIGSGVATKVSGVADNLGQSLALTSGAAYLITYTLPSISGGGAFVRLIGSAVVDGAIRTTTGTFSEIVFAPASMTTFAIRAQSATNVTIDNVSVKPLTVAA